MKPERFRLQSRTRTPEGGQSNWLTYGVTRTFPSFTAADATLDHALLTFTAPKRSKNGGWTVMERWPGYAYVEHDDRVTGWEYRIVPVEA